MVVDTFANRLKKAMNLRHMKQVDLVEKTQIDKSLISNYLKGKYKAKQDNLYLLAKVLDVNEAWLMGYDVDINRIPDNLRNSEITLKELYKDTVPLLGTVKAGYNYLVSENILDYIPVTFKKEDDNYYALKIKGNSMEPILSEGDTVIVHKQDFFESGKFCIVLINGEEATVKKVYKLEDGIELIALNPAYPSKKYTKKDMDKIPVKVIGVVKQLIKKLD